MRLRLCFLIAVFLYPELLPAQNLVDDPFLEMDKFWDAIADRNWPIVVGIMMTILVWVVRKYFFRDLPAKYLPVFVLLLPVAGAMGSRMVQYAADGKHWWQGLIQGMFEGLMIGFTAMGAWDTKKSSKRFLRVDNEQ